MERRYVVEFGLPDGRSQVVSFVLAVGAMNEEGVIAQARRTLERSVGAQRAATAKVLRVSS